MNKSHEEVIEQLLEIVRDITRLAIYSDGALAEFLNPYMKRVYETSSLNSSQFREAIRSTIKEELFKSDPKKYLERMSELRIMLENQIKKWGG